MLSRRLDVYEWRTS